MTVATGVMPLPNRCGMVPLLVHPAAARATVFVYYKDRADLLRPAGTAFVVGDEIEGTGHHFLYLVTARHVIEVCRASTDRDHLYLRMNTPTGSGFVPMSFEQWFGHPADDDSKGTAWLAKRTDRRVDVAAAMVTDMAGTNVLPWAWKRHALTTAAQVAEHGVAPGYDVAIIGLYRNHIGKQRNIPIVRAGIVAAMPEEPVDTSLGPMDAYLVETRSLGGLSGSPVYWISGRHRLADDGQLVAREWHQMRLLGLVHGHFDVLDSDAVASAHWPVPERMNEGMSIVVPTAYIDEVMHREDFMERRKPIEDGLRDNEAAVMDTLSPDDRVSLDPLDPETALRALLDTPKPEEKA